MRIASITDASNLFFFVSVAVAALLLVMTIMSRLNQA